MERAPLPKARHIHPDKLAAAKEFNSLIKLGIICPSLSSWDSPLHMVLKSLEGGGSVLYCALNDIITPDQSPIPHYRTLNLLCKGLPSSPRVIVVHASKQILVFIENIPNTAIIMPFGLMSWSECHMASGMWFKPFYVLRTRQLSTRHDLP